MGGQCGIFVDADAARDGDGTQDSPRTSIGGAIAQAEDGDTIFVCASVAGHVEAVTLSKSVMIVGGLDCATWSYEAAGRTGWTAASDAIPLRVTGASTDAHVEGFAITSADAGAAGSSSIGVLVHEATLDLERTTIEAGSGAAGVSPGQEARGPRAQKGVDGAAGCTTDGVIGGGGGGQNTCQGSNRDGGLGGSGTESATFGGNGNPGSPFPDAGGAAGLGEGFATCGTGGTGGDGDPGSGGDPGLGAPASSDGTLSSTGFTPEAGLRGTSVGTPGAGGGGGGGANACEPTDGTDAGPSGGGGGAGGCGGAVGAPGGGGGSSIAVAAIDATVTLTNVTLVAGEGGDGGDGTPGQLGQQGGLGGENGGPGACLGGLGGDGGQGGSGGGGRGGHALGIAWTGTEPTQGAGVTIEPGTAGDGGDGGVGLDVGNTGGAGAAGEQASVLELSGA